MFLLLFFRFRPFCIPLPGLQVTSQTVNCWGWVGGWGHNNDVGLHRLDRRFVAVAASSFFPQGGLSFAGALGLSYMLLLLRVGKFRDIGELPPNLKNWFLVVVFYVDSLLVCAGWCWGSFGYKHVVGGS